MYARERAPDDECAAVKSRLQRRVLARAALAVVLVHDQRPRLVPRLEALCDVRNRVCRRFARCVVWVGSDVDFTAFVVDSLPVGVSSLQRAADAQSYSDHCNESTHEKNSTRALRTQVLRNVAQMTLVLQPRPLRSSSARRQSPQRSTHGCRYVVRRALAAHTQQHLQRRQLGALVKERPKRLETLKAAGRWRNEHLDVGLRCRHR